MYATTSDSRAILVMTNYMCGSLLSNSECSERELPLYSSEPATQHRRTNTSDTDLSRVTRGIRGLRVGS
jgi:hypothetical protein